MTKKEMKDLARVIVEEIMTQQREYDRQFLEDVKLLTEDDPNLEVTIEDKASRLEDRLDNMQTILSHHIYNQEFHKAAAVHQQMMDFKTKYNL